MPQSRKRCRRAGRGIVELRRRFGYVLAAFTGTTRRSELRVGVLHFTDVNGPAGCLEADQTAPGRERHAYSIGSVWAPHCCAGNVVPNAFRKWHLATRACMPLLHRARLERVGHFETITGIDPTSVLRPEPTPNRIASIIHERHRRRQDALAACLRRERKYDKVELTSMSLT